MNNPWMQEYTGYNIVFTFTFPNRGKYIVVVSERVKKRLDEEQPDRVHIWMAGPYDDPDLFVPMLTHSPRIEDFDLLRLRKEDEVW